MLYYRENFAIICTVCIQEPCFAIELLRFARFDGIFVTIIAQVFLPEQPAVVLGDPGAEA